MSTSYRSTKKEFPSKFSYILLLTASTVTVTVAGAAAVAK